MLYQEAVVENGQVKIIKSKEINQSTLTSECWLIQFNGLEACTNCEFLNKRNCGGKAIRKKLLSNM